MIKKLRRKFILINMALVTLVLLIVFAVLCISNLQKYENDSQRTLEHALLGERQDLKPKLDFGRGPEEDKMPQFSAAFVVYLDADRKISHIDDSGVSVSSSYAENAVEQALNTGEQQGKLRELNLRYLMITDVDGARIAFKDYSYEQNAMKDLLINSALIFIGGLLAFFVISVFLSRWALGPVEKAWRQQKQFVADASHELKTPLTVILANLGILGSHPDNTIREQSRWVENTQLEAARMKQLLDDLLFLAKTDASRVPVVFSQFDLSNTLWSCILPFESLAYEQQITMEEEIAPDIYMNGDENQMKQLIAILLDNACKYAGKGGLVTIRFARRQDKPERAILEVSNTGAVIPAEDLEHIFERFYRSDKSRVRTKGGYGLGLSIAKAIVDNHHGKIQVSSTSQNGTAFTVTLPVLLQQQREEK